MDATQCILQCDDALQWYKRVHHRLDTSSLHWKERSFPHGSGEKVICDGLWEKERRVALAPKVVRGEGKEGGGEEEGGCRRPR